MTTRYIAWPGYGAGETFRTRAEAETRIRVLHSRGGEEE